jgi:hypothetical protein
MTIAQRMQSVRDAFPECRLVAFADLAAGMVLSVSSESSRMQEEMNGLCATAVETLGGHTTGHLAPVFARAAAPGIFEVIIMERREIGVFLRSTTQPNDAFCCVCTPDIALADFLSVARKALDNSGDASWS